MRGSLSLPAWKRAIIAMVAGYALLLQAFVAAATPAATPDALGIICADHGTNAPSSDKSARHQHGCCTAVHVGTIAPPPLAPIVVAWAAPLATPVVWRAEAAIPKTGPPPGSHSARGPPVA